MGRGGARAPQGCDFRMHLLDRATQNGCLGGFCTHQLRVDGLQRGGIVLLNPEDFEPSPHDQAAQHQDENQHHRDAAVQLRAVLGVENRSRPVQDHRTRWQAFLGQPPAFQLGEINQQHLGRIEDDGQAFRCLASQDAAGHFGHQPPVLKTTVDVTPHGPVTDRAVCVGIDRPPLVLAHMGNQLLVGQRRAVCHFRDRTQCKHDGLLGQGGQAGIDLIEAGRCPMLDNEAALGLRRQIGQIRGDVLPVACTGFIARRDENQPLGMRVQ